MRPHRNPKAGRQQKERRSAPFNRTRFALLALTQLSNTRAICVRLWAARQMRWYIAKPRQVAARGHGELVGNFVDESRLIRFTRAHPRFGGHHRGNFLALAAGAGAQNYPARAIQMVVAHEAGHAFGMEHNQKASSLYPHEKLRDPEWVRTMGFTPSVMDYVRFNYVAQPEDGIAIEDLVLLVVKVELRIDELDLIVQSVEEWDALSISFNGRLGQSSERVTIRERGALQHK